MKLSNYIPPYPILSPYRNDITGTFGGSVEYATSAHNLELRATFNLDNSDLQTLINAGKAVFSLDVVCSKTFFRESFINKNPLICEKLPIGDFKDSIECSLLVVATENFTYTNSAFHEYFNGALFEIEAGDVLAIDHTHKFFLELRPEEISKVGSFMRVVKDDRCTLDEVKVDLGSIGTSDTIDIKLSPQSFARYSKTKDKYSKYYHSAMVLPTLIHALGVLFEGYSSGNSDYSDRMWAEILDARLNFPDLKLVERKRENIFLIASKILDWPLSKSIRDLHEKSVEKFDQSDNNS